MKCNKCSFENKSTNIRCEQCGNVLIDVEKVNSDLEFGNHINNPVAEKKALGIGKFIIIVIILLFEAPFILAGIFLFGLGIYFNVSESKIIKSYKETSGILVDYVECSYNENGETCLGLYEYEIDGTVYSVKNNVSTNPENLEKEVKVYYDENKPEEALIKTNFWDILLVIGFAFTVITLLPIIIILFIFKKANKAVDLDNENKPITI